MIYFVNLLAGDFRLQQPLIIVTLKRLKMFMTLTLIGQTQCYYLTYYTDLLLYPPLADNHLAPAKRCKKQSQGCMSVSLYFLTRDVLMYLITLKC